MNNAKYMIEQPVRRKDWPDLQEVVKEESTIIVLIVLEERADCAGGTC